MAKLHWAAEIRRCLPAARVALVEGTRAGPLGEADYYVANYDLLERRIGDLRTLRAQCLVLDELHYVKNHRSRRSQAVQSLAEGIPFLIGMTGTIAVNRSSELLQPLGILNRLEEFGGFWAFVNRCCPPEKPHQKVGRGGRDADKLHRRLRETCYLRRLKKDALPQLPEKQQETYFVALPPAAQSEYDLAENDFVQWLLSQRKSDADAFTLRAEELQRLNALR